MRNIITHKLERTDIEVKKHIKSFAALCSMAMVFSIFSVGIMASDPDPITLNQQYVTDHSGKLPVESGDYVLTEDITVSDTTQIDVDQAKIKIDLAGNKIIYSGTGSLYIVGKVEGLDIVADEVELTITDSVGGGMVTVADGYTGGGSVDHWISYNSSGTNTEGRGGCILIQNGSTFKLAGGTISGFYATHEGGGVHVSNGAHFIMTGGTITNCSALHGGALTVHTATGGRTHETAGINIAGYAELLGGKITGNTATNGGGVRVLRGDLRLGSCEITGNTSTGTGDNGGGGIAISKPDKYTQVLTIEGTPKVYGNTGADADKSDIFFVKGTAFTLNGDLSSDAKISFGAKVLDTNNQYFKVGTYSYDINSFSCPNTSYEPFFNSSKKAIMVKKVTVPSVDGCRVSVSGIIELKPQINLGTFDDDNASVTYSYSYTKNGKTTTNTNTFTKAQLTKRGSYYEFSIPVESACMTAPIDITIAYGTKGATVTKSVSIEEYVMGMLADSTGTYSQKEKDAAEALLIYGGYAQVQLGIYADKLPQNGVDYTSASFDAISAVPYAIGKDTNGAYYGTSVSFLSATSVKMYFKKSVLGDNPPAMVVTGYSDPIPAASNGNYYVYTIKGVSGNGFPATQYNVSFDFSIGDDISGSYSVDTYLKAIKANSNSSAAMKNLAEAYYNFAQKCIALTLN